MSARLGLMPAALLLLAAAPDRSAIEADARLARAVARTDADRARIAKARAPAVALLAAMQWIALRPPALAFAQPGTIRDAARTRALLAAMTPALATRTAALTQALAQSRAEQRIALEALESAMPEEARIAPEPGLASRLGRLAAPDLDPAPSTSEHVFRLPTRGTLLAGAGEAQADGSRSRGLLLATPAGAAVRAPAPGRIAYAGRFGSYRSLLIIDHGRGWTTLLAGMRRLTVLPGQEVRAGELLGVMPGSRPRLTFELRRAGRPIDVAAMLAAG